MTQKSDQPADHHHAENLVFPVSEDWAARAHADKARYQDMYAQSVADPDAFWAEEAMRLTWDKPFTKVKNTSFELGHVSIKWFEDGTLNASVNCIDRHLASRGDQTAIIWEGDEPTDDAKITYRELYEKVCRFANVLKSQGVRKGDRVTIYMPMIPEAAYAMLACARIGAVHSIVFGGFSPEALAGRILDCTSTCIITSDEGVRGGKKIPLKANTDKALEQCPDVTSVIVCHRTGDAPSMIAGRDVWLHEEMEKASADCAPEEMSAEDPLFILYTSGSTGKPKGVLHTTGGYMVFAAMTHEYVFDYHDGDVYWCTPTLAGSPVTLTLSMARLPTARRP